METEFPSDFFVLLDSFETPVRREIKLACATMSIKPDEIIYEQGSVSDGVYVVMSGVVEVLTFSPDKKQSRSVASMSRGDFFGDLAVFIGQPRMATVRAREATELLYIEQEAFLRLVKKVPELGFFFCRQLAHRLHRTSSDAHLRVYAIDLSGNLRRFDLLTIVQSITSTGNSGELHLHNSANQLLGSFFFRQGRVEHAQFGHLVGLEAIWQGFIESTSEGTFLFTALDQPSVAFAPEHKIEVDSTNLLMQGVGKRDVYNALPLTLRLMKGRLVRQTLTLTWKDAETQAAAERIWSCMTDQPQSLYSLWRQLNYSAISFLEVVMEMGMNGQAELLLEVSEAEELGVAAGS